MARRRGHKKRKKKTVETLRSHFLKRLGQRHNISLSHEDYDALCRQIREGLSEPVYRESTNRHHHHIEIEGKTVTVVYNSLLGGLVTVFPDPVDN